MDKRVVLVADDEADLRQLMAERLREAGYAVLEAGDGKEAVVMAREWQPDIILMDCMMPEMDGPTAGLALAGDVETKDIPILYLSCLVGENEGAVIGLQKMVLISKLESTDALLKRVQETITVRESKVV